MANNLINPSNSNFYNNKNSIKPIFLISTKKNNNILNFKSVIGKRIT